MKFQLLDYKSIEEGIKLNSLATQFPLFVEKEFEEEKGVVNQELDEYIAKPDSCAENGMLKNLFGIESSSSDLTCGKKENINALTREVVFDYYNTWYSPDNAVTVITGDVDVDETMQLVSKYYNKKPDVSKINNRQSETLKPITQPVRKDIFVPGSYASTICLGFPIENTTVMEREKINFMFNCINSPSSTLSKRLNEIGACCQFGISQLSSDDSAPRALQVNMYSPEEKNEEALKILYEEIHNFINNPPSDSFVQQKANNILENIKNSSLNTDGISGLLTDIVQKNNFNYFKELPSTLLSMNTKTVSELAKKYLDLNRVSICVTHPENTSANEISNKYNKANIRGQGNNVSFGKKINVATSLNEEKQNIKQLVLNNNIYLSTVKTDNNADCSLKMFFEGDYNLNISKGECAVIKELLNGGSVYTGKDNYEKLQEQMNIGLDFSFSNNTISVSSDFPSDKANEMINLFKSVLLNPNFNQAEFDMAKQKIRQNIVDTPDSATKNMLKTIFSNNKNYISKEEQLKILDNMTLQDVYRIYFNLLNNSQCGVALSLPKDNSDYVEQTVVNNLSFNMPIARPFIKEIDMQASLYQTNLQEKIICDVQEKPKAEVVKSYQYKFTNNLEDKI